MLAIKTFTLYVSFGLTYMTKGWTHILHITEREKYFKRKYEFIIFQMYGMRYCLANKKAMKLHKTAEEMGKVTEACNILMHNIFTRLSTKPDFILKLNDH